MAPLSVFLSEKVYRAARPVYLFFVLAVFLSLIPLSSAQAAEGYLEELLKAAHEKHLSEQRYWDVLLLYKEYHGGRKSLIDDPRYFLAADGKVNPSAELDATISSFFREEKKDEEHPRCRFVARYTWLKQELNINEQRLPPAACEDFKEAFSRVRPHSATLVFPATHNNGPASMFGHTLIRIDSENQSGLLSYAATYAAYAPNPNAFLYPIKGMFGLYPGYFSILPYYDKVAEYSNIEDRDIWEYPLNLTEAEVTRMVLHLWEVRDIYSDYYFFDENCSFDLLLLLEAARPSLRLSDAFWDNKLRFWVMPVDTIREIKAQGLVTGEHYRPSHARRIQAIAAGMNREDQERALALADRTITPESVKDLASGPEAEMRILDLGAELLQYHYARKDIGKDEYLKQFLPVLRVRSTLGQQSDNAYPVPQPVPPEDGHFPGRVSLAAGYRSDSFFTELGWRAAYHDLLDPDQGYTEGAQILFMDVRGRYYPQQDSLRLQQLALIDIVSLAPRNRFFQPVSWKVNTGFYRQLMADGEEHLVYRISPGAGLCYAPVRGSLVYIMADADLNFTGMYQRNYSLGFGGSGGWLQKLTAWWSLDLSAQALFYGLGDEHQSIKAGAVQSFFLGRNSSIRLAIERERTFDHYQTEGSLSWMLYLR